MHGTMELRATESGFCLMRADGSVVEAAQTAETAQELPRRSANVKVSCTHLASCKGPDGTQHHIIFNPDARTRKRLHAWKRSDCARGITVDDRSGRYSRDVTGHVVSLVEDYGTIVLTTDC